jgi:parallel beta-helix repeat protein
LEELQIVNCGGNGANIFGQAAVRNCKFSGNGSNGLVIAEGVISGCLAQSNKMSGIYIRSDAGGVVENCHVNYNGNGIKALSSLVTHCMASYNTTNGIIAYGACRVIDNVVYRNGCGIYLDSVFDDIENNSIVWNQAGIIATNYSPHIIVRNTFTANTTNMVVGLGNTAPLPISLGNGITNAGPWINIAY